jgi:hypothetical protein
MAVDDELVGAERGDIRRVVAEIGVPHADRAVVGWASC